MRTKKILAMAVVLAMMLTILPLTVGAASVSDFYDLPDPGHWSYNGIVSVIENGIMEGYGDGTFKPFDNIKLAEASAYLARAMNAQTQANISGLMSQGTDYWGYSYIAKAVQMGLIPRGQINPEALVTTEMAFDMMQRIIKAPAAPLSVLDRFADAAEISPQYRASIAALVQAGHVRGDDVYGELFIRPQQFVERGRFATVFGRVMPQYVTAAGTYTSSVSGNVVVNTDGVTLKDMTVNGDLIVGDGLGDGTLILDNVRVTGQLVARGGGTDSIIIRNGSSVGTVVVTRVDGAVRVFVDGSQVEVIFIADGTDNVIIEGEVGSVVIDSDVPVTINATVDEVVVAAEGADVTLGADAEVGTLTVSEDASGASVALENGASVENMTVEAENVDLNVARGAEIENLVIEENASGTDVSGGGTIANTTDNSTDSTTPPPSGGNGGSGGGGGGGIFIPPPVDTPDTGTAPTVTPVSGTTFDKNTANTAAGGYVDATFTVNLGSGSLAATGITSISRVDEVEATVPTESYIFDGTTGALTIKKEYLATLSTRTWQFEITFNDTAATVISVSIEVSDTTPVSVVFTLVASDPDPTKNEFTTMATLLLAAAGLSETEAITIQIGTALTEPLVLTENHLPGSNLVTVKPTAAYATALTYGVLVARGNVTLDGLKFSFTATTNMIKDDYQIGGVPIGDVVQGGCAAIWVNDVANVTVKNCTIAVDVTSGRVCGIFSQVKPATGKLTLTGNNVNMSGTGSATRADAVYAASAAFTGNNTLTSNKTTLVLQWAGAFDASYITFSGINDITGQVSIGASIAELSADTTTFGTTGGGIDKLKPAVATYVGALVDMGVRVCLYEAVHPNSANEELYYANDEASAAAVPGTWQMFSTDYGASYSYMSQAIFADAALEVGAYYTLIDDEGNIIYINSTASQATINYMGPISGLAYGVLGYGLNSARTYTLLKATPFGGAVNVSILAHCDCTNDGRKAYDPVLASGGTYDPMTGLLSIEAQYVCTHATNGGDTPGANVQWGLMLDEIVMEGLCGYARREDTDALVLSGSIWQQVDDGWAQVDGSGTLPSGGTTTPPALYHFITPLAAPAFIADSAIVYIGTTAESSNHFFIYADGTMRFIKVTVDPSAVVTPVPD